jgi:hypothetical protein
MQFPIDVFHSNTPAYYIVHTIDFENFHLKLKSYKGYQSYLPEEIILKKLPDEPVIVGKRDTGKFKPKWQLIQPSFDYKFVNLIIEEIDIWIGNNVVKWEPTLSD